MGIVKMVKVKSYPCNRPWKPIGMRGMEAPTFFRQSLTDGGEAVISAHQPITLLSQEGFLALISRGCVVPWATVQLEGSAQLELQ
jgi:hypothetical protein